MKRWPIYAAVMACLLATPSLAQTVAPAPIAAVGTPVPSATPPADIQQRLALAQKINQISPAGLQIDNAITQLSQRLPAQNRDDFKQRLTAVIDKKALETLSIKAMAFTYTVPELQRMFEYMSSPEARSIAEKTKIYNQLMRPEIIKMLDKGMLDAKIGQNPQTPFATAPANPFPAPVQSQSAIAPHIR